MKKDKIRQVVVYTGFFNPFQIQHEKLVRWIIKNPAYDQIWIFINNQSEYKEFLLPFQLRVEIIRTVFKAEKKVIVKTRKIPYITNQLLTTLHQDVKTETKFWLLLGSDNWNALPTWEEGEALMEKTNFLVAKRANFKIQTFPIPAQTRAKILPLKATMINSSAIRQGKNWNWLNPSTRILLWKHPAFLQHILKQHLSAEKFAHSRRVWKMMQTLNTFYRLKQTPQAIWWSAWFHDLTKSWSKAQTLAFFAEQKGEETRLIGSPFPVWHSKSAALYLEKVLKCPNRSVYQAIAQHTTGAKKMSKLAQLLFVADKIEPGKTTNNASWIRQQMPKLSFQKLFRLTLKNVAQTLLNRKKTLTSAMEIALKTYT